MRKWISWVWSIALSSVILIAGGCGSANNPADESSHGHVHGHGDAHSAEQQGPNGGDLIKFDKPGYTAELLHEGNAGQVTIIILDADAKQEVGIAAENVFIEAVVSGLGAPIEYKLAAVGRTTGDNPTASRFEVKNRQLVTNLDMHEGVKNTLTVEIDGEMYSGEIEHHHHHHHGHKH